LPSSEKKKRERVHNPRSLFNSFRRAVLTKKNHAKKRRWPRRKRIKKQKRDRAADAGRRKAGDVGKKGSTPKKPGFCEKGGKEDP